MLHHVDIYKAFRRILDAVKVGGLVLIMEPVAFSTRLQKIRDFLPVKKDISPDERQLNQKEIDYLFRHLDILDVSYFHLFGRLARFISNRNKIDKGHPFAKYFMHILLWTDVILLKVLPGLKRYSGIILCAGYKIK